MTRTLEPKNAEQKKASSHVGTACRFCSHPLSHTFVDLGSSPLCQRHIEPEQWNQMEPFYPLHAWVCEKCFLVQLDEYVSPGEIFKDYAYFSSFSTSWLEHAKKYTEQMTARFALGKQSRVVELASNDGYLLQYFMEQGVTVLGVEPAANVAQAAIDKGIPTVVKFFGQQTAQQIRAAHGPADLLLGNNVLAHVPKLNDFVAGMKTLLAADGVITMEFPHLVQLMMHNQFDTIYHEHFSYLSFTTVEKVFAFHGLTLFDVDELPTHGGSLRIYGRHTDDATKPVHCSRGRIEEARSRVWHHTPQHLFIIRRKSEGDQAQTAGVFNPGQARGKNRSRIRRAGQRQHAAQLLRNPHRFSGLHRRSKPPQARPISSRHSHSDSAPRQDQRNPPGLRADFARGT